MKKTGSISPLYNIGAVTRITGVPIATLHAWERRYGYPVAERTAGGHRLYSEKDIAGLRWIKSQVDSGLAVSRAVIAVRALEAEGRIFLKDDPATRINVEPRSNASLCDSLLNALTHHDLFLADQLLGEMLAFYSAEYMTLNIIGPTLSAIGEAWERGNISIATEHFASNYLRHRLLMWIVTGPSPKPVSPIVLACAPGERHEGSLLMMGVLLRRQGWPIAYLGQDVPFHDLALFIDNIHPQAVVLVAMGKKTGNALVEWPESISQIGGKPIITFGGRAFVVQPELKSKVPGTYLGDTIKDGMTNLVSIIQQASK
jgi:DNA-binding transcriptional MerR regulator